MSFGIFEASVSSDVEARLDKQASVDKMASAIYDCREKLGPALFASATIEEFRHKVAMMKNDQSIYKIIGAHLDPVSGVVRRVVGKGGALEKEFKAILATGITASDDDDDDKSDKDDGFGGKKAPPFGSKDSRRRAAGEADPRDQPFFGGTWEDPSDPSKVEPWQDMTGIDRDRHARQRISDFSGDVNVKSTFKPSDDELIPEGNFDSYLNKVDQNSDKVKSHVFAMYTDWAQINGLDPRRKATVLSYTGNNRQLYVHLARTIQGWDFSHQPKAPTGQSKTKLKDVTASGDMYHVEEGNGWRGGYLDDEPPSHSIVNPETGDTLHYNNPHTKALQDHLKGGEPIEGREARRDPMRHYIAWCKRNGYKRLSARNIEIYSQGNPRLCMHLAERARAAVHTAYQRQAAEGGGNPNYHPNTVDPSKMWNNFNELDTSGHDPRQHQGRTAAADYLQKANDALTQLLNQKAEEFQETIAPLQQALVTVQQATQIQQQQNPMNVLPPPGTVNVMPGGDGQGPAGMPAPGAQDLGPAAAALAGAAGGDPSGGGAPAGGPPTPGADPAGGAGPAGPPPAAAGGGLPPEMDPAAQKAARRRGGQGKARGAARPREGREAASVGELWNKWNQQNTGIGGEADYQNFQQQFGVGDQALTKLKQQHQTQGPNTGIVAAQQPNMAEEASKSQWRQMDSRMSELGYKYDKSAGHWMKPGQMPIRNHWQHTGNRPYVPNEYIAPQGYEEERATRLGPLSAQEWDEQYAHNHKHEAGWGERAKNYLMSEPTPFADTKPGHQVQHLKDKAGEFGQHLQDASEDWQNGHGGVFADEDAVPRMEERARFAGRRQAWTGWGPAQFPKARQVEGWNWDQHLNGYLANKPQHFACECGDSFPAPSGFNRCACGRQWNSYVIGTGGSSREAAADKFLVREIPVRPDVIMANRQMVARTQARLVDRSGKIHTLVDPGEVDPDGGTDAGHSTFRKQPADWAHRGDGARWQKSPIGK